MTDIKAFVDSIWAGPETVRDHGDQFVAIETAASAGFHAEIMAHPFIEGWMIINDRQTRFPLATTAQDGPAVLSVTSDERALWLRRLGCRPSELRSAPG